jgi:hypothetical protein
MLAFTCILLVAVFGFSRAEESEEEVLLFHSWKQEHKKVYDNKDEERTRFQNFKANVKDIQMRNLQSQKEYGKDGAVFGINEFSGILKINFCKLFHFTNLIRSFIRRILTKISF